MKQIKLYIKCHKETNLQYFGKTEQPLDKYKGSGLHWDRHIKKHGYNVDTICIGIYDENDPMLIQHALGFSACNDIVNSKEWANMKPENGKDGGWCFINSNNRGENNHFYGKKHTKVTRKLMKLNHTKPMLGKTFSEEHKRKIGESNKGKNRSEEVKNKISETLRNKPKIKCPHCKKEGGISIMQRWHFDNCKDKA